MTIKEAIELQDTTGNLYLIRQGLFYRGYNQSAVFLSEVFGCQVLTKEVKSCDRRVFYVGFPASFKNQIVETIVLRGGIFENNADDLLVISGITFLYDEIALSLKAKPPRRRSTRNKNHREYELSLADEIIGFDLTGSTPVDCMNFIGRLQAQLISNGSDSGSKNVL